MSSRAQEAGRRPGPVRMKWALAAALICTLCHTGVEAGSAESEMVDARDETAVSGRRAATGGDEIVDIAVSRIGQTGSDYAEYGVYDGIAAFSAATTACNVGTAEAEWMVGSSGRHPLIGQNLYRLSGDSLRFEMIGMSWLKHSFCAVNETSCGTCQGTLCPTLGLGCADTYTALRNGVTGLGPRRDVNPMGTQFNGAGPGTHDHPHADPTGDSIIRGRLQVKVEDLDGSLNPGARYFMEIHYITHDEQLSERYNNASWVEVLMPSSHPYTADIFSSGSVQMGAAALEAWRGIDPQVVIEEYHDVQQGLLQLGYRVTENLDGTWHFEYALHNMNSHLGVSTFAVPVADGAKVSDVRFHDVFYHSGDGMAGTFSGEDWEASDIFLGQNRVIRWATQTFGQDSNANALRWGSTYNFRFDADMPPVDAEVLVTHYRDNDGGGNQPGSFTIQALVPSAPLVLCPADLDGDGDVDAADLAGLIAAWGPHAGHPADFDGDGRIDAADLAFLLNAWGSCN